VEDYANALQELAKKAGVPLDEEKDISLLKPVNTFVFYIFFIYFVFIQKSPLFLYIFLLFSFC
jgi:hypothetical protein